MTDQETHRAIMIELRNVLAAGWSARIEDGKIGVSGPDDATFVSEVWRIARFVAYADFVSLERHRGPPLRYTLVSRSQRGLAFEIAFTAEA